MQKVPIFINGQQINDVPYVCSHKWVIEEKRTGIPLFDKMEQGAPCVGFIRAKIYICERCAEIRFVRE